MYIEQQKTALLKVNEVALLVLHEQGHKIKNASHFSLQNLSTPILFILLYSHRVCFRLNSQYIQLFNINKRHVKQKVKFRILRTFPVKSFKLQTSLALYCFLGCVF